MLEIKRSDSSKITKDFKAKEFYTKSEVPEHFVTKIDERLPIIAQIIRDYANSEVVVTSTLRTDEHQQQLKELGLGSSSSQHQLGRAIDLQIKDLQMHNLIVKDLLNKDSNLFIELRKVGVTGIGIYNTFIHLDVREGGGLQKDRFGSFAFWDFRTNTKKVPAPIHQGKNSSETTKLGAIISFILSVLLLK